MKIYFMLKSDKYNHLERVKKLYSNKQNFNKFQNDLWPKELRGLRLKITLMANCFERFKPFKSYFELCKM